MDCRTTGIYIAYIVPYAGRYVKRVQKNGNKSATISGAAAALRGGIYPLRWWGKCAIINLILCEIMPHGDLSLGMGGAHCEIQYKEL